MVQQEILHGGRHIQYDTSPSASKFKQNLRAEASYSPKYYINMPSQEKDNRLKSSKKQFGDPHRRYENITNLGVNKAQELKPMLKK